MVIHLIVAFWICAGHIVRAQVASSASPAHSNELIRHYTGSNPDYKRLVVYNTNEQEQSLFRYPPRSLEQWSLTDVLLVSTIDGSLHARDRKTGMELWSLPGSGPLVSVTSSDVLETDPQYEDDRQIIWIIEPLGDGTLYYFVPNRGLQVLPMTIKELVARSPFSIGGRVYTGSKHTTLFSINATDGKVLRVYGAESSKSGLGESDACGDKLQEEELDDDFYTSSKHTLTDQGTFMIGRTDYHLEIHSTNETIWNVTSSVWGPNNMDSDLASQHLLSPDGLYIMPLPNKEILALSTDGLSKKPARWVSQVSSPVVGVFDIMTSANRLDSEPLVLLKQPEFPSTTSTSHNPYSRPPLGTYVEDTEEGQWFALSGERFPSLVNSTAPAGWNDAQTRDHFIAHGQKSDLPQLIRGVHQLSPDVWTTEWKQDSSVSQFPSSIVAQSNAIIPTAAHGPPRRDVGLVPPRAMMHPDQPYYAYPQLPPPPSARSVWTHFFMRLVENAVIIALLGGLLVFVANKGWIPQLVFMVKRENNSLETVGGMKDEDAVAPVPQQVSLPISNNEKESEKDQTEVGGDDGLTISDTTNINQEEEQGDNEHVAFVEPSKQTSQQQDKPKKRKRGSRGGRKLAARNALKSAVTELNNITTNSDNEEGGEQNNKNNTNNNHVEHDDDEADNSDEEDSTSNQIKKVGQLQVYMNETIGLGSQGTTVFRGIFEDRQVAVKRMLLNFYKNASQEVTALQESDDHPNVIRYFCKYEQGQFLYIALELCPGTLGDIIEKPMQFESLREQMDPIQVMQQIAAGVNHLHQLKLVHRDIKPQNILVAPSKKLPNGKLGPVRMMISDFGLCKKLEDGQSSFRNTRTGVGGTAGWTAPEITMGTRYPLSVSVSGARLTNAVDIFSLGCVFYYILTNGKHPFGTPSKRESNIEDNCYDLSDIDELSVPDDPEVARDLIERMISFDWTKRPSAHQLLEHPFFWSPQKKMNFLVSVSDRFEGEARGDGVEFLPMFEQDAAEIVGEDWHSKLDKSFVETLNKYRKYRGERMIDLIRAMRNKFNHFDDLPPSLKQVMGPGPAPFLRYFTRRFPMLLTKVYYFCREHFSQEERFRPYFECE